MIAIKLKNVELDFFYHHKKKSFKKTLIKGLFKSFIEKEQFFPPHRALDGLNLTIETGDKIAIIGKNGSGKSSLLRLISGIYEPTSGSLEVEGKLTSILSLEVGLNLDLTGYQNMILMGIVQGSSKKKMKERFSEIEEFTELGKYLHLPVKTYSSGMRLRLAFGIITSMQSDILLLDEIIGVGDQNFMQKAQKRIEALAIASKILLLASHSTTILEKFCNKALVLDRGKVTFYGSLQKGISQYENSLQGNL